MAHGPCVICGATNYGLSGGGTSICPACDCGDFGIARIRLLETEIDRRQTENAHLQARVDWCEYHLNRPAIRTLLDDDQLDILDRRKVSDET